MIKLIIECLPFVLLAGWALYSLNEFIKAKKNPDDKNPYLFDIKPQMFTTIGLFGTFLGIAYGLSSFDVNKIEESIPILLDGLRTAFYASIAGIVLYCIAAYLIAKQQWQQDKEKLSEVKLTSETLALNKLIEIVTEIKNQYNSSFIEEKNNTTEPTFFLEEISKKSDEQTKALTELIGQISGLKKDMNDAFLLINGNKNIVNLIEVVKDIKIEIGDLKKNITEDLIYCDVNDDNNKIKLTNVFKDIYKEATIQTQALKSFSTDLSTKIEAGFDTILSNPRQDEFIAELQAVRLEIENLGKKLQDPTTEMTQNIVKDLQENMATMVSNFQDTVSDTAKNELERLISIIKEASDNLNKLPTSIIELQSGQSELMSKQTENLELSNNLMDQFNKNIEKMNGVSNEVSTTITNFNNVQIELNKVADNLKDISELVNSSSTSLVDNQLEINRHSKEFQENNEKVILEIKAALDSAKEVATDYSKKFKIIETGLKDIFGNIEIGLTQYRQTVGDSLNSFLAEYTYALTQTAESLESVVNKQEGILQELNEQFEKLTNKK